MKKIIVLLITAALLLSGCTAAQTTPQGATEPTQEAEVSGFQAGFSRKNMNPATSVPLAGYSNALNRYMQSIGQDITCTALAISDGDGGDLLLISVDLTNSQEAVMSMISQNISTKTGIPVSNIVISATHTHSAPDMTNRSLPEEAAYIALVSERLLVAAQEALADRSAATLYVGSIETENLNFVRHYLVENKLTGEVSVAGDHFGSFQDATILGHASEGDPTLHLVPFKRADKADIVLANWAAHPHFTGGASKYVLSSDFVGPFRETLEDMTGSNVIFFQGAAGDLNESSKINSERRTSDHRTYGALLAGYADSCLQSNMTAAATGAVRTLQVDFAGEINHSQDHLYAAANAVKAQWNQTYSTTDCKPLMEPHGIRSVYQALAIVSNYNRTSDDGRMSLKAITIGESVAIVTFPGELFSGLYTQLEQSALFPTTLLFGYADQHVSYLPTQAAYEYTCYESDISRFAPGTGEQVLQQYITMLEALGKEAPHA